VRESGRSFAVPTYLFVGVSYLAVRGSAPLRERQQAAT
jgi:hypothetical protein